MSEKKFNTQSAEETEKLGEMLASYLKEGMTLAFYGNLGAGKTTLIRGICKGMGIAHGVKSPSFVIVIPYKGGRLPVYHIDAYRLDSHEDLVALGPEDFFTADGVALVEWAERVEPVLPPDSVVIKMRAIADEPDSRAIIIDPLPEEW
ncbi:MAG: tRNA (adenosine(37)-N6)-threonylcarbamoyltransferase complex ATPase subunit type 1 TsaE [Chloroflexi bacterium]|nr:tRNA (adenosine(37)-N6)-threonylcarbamoyltransferase complex ATPase subunit type 1 TsaE [Chloroflexota bacterium]